MIEYKKPALTYSAQIALLESRGLVITDRTEAEQWLEKVGYYRLSGYFVPFKLSGADTFKPAVTFQNVVGLYRFDSQLRLLFMEALDRIEIAVRAVLTYDLAHAFGPFGHIYPSNFIRGFDHRTFMVSIDREEKRSRELFIRHYRATYSDFELPIWIATELLSLGGLSIMYAHLPPNRRKKIARPLNTPEAVLVSWLHSLTNIRNICAHHSRLWNRELPVRPTLLHAWRSASISNDRVYCVALILQHLLTAVSAADQWKAKLKTLFNQYPDVNLSAMQFPAGWQTVPPWA